MLRTLLLCTLALPVVAAPQDPAPRIQSAPSDAARAVANVKARFAAARRAASIELGRAETDEERDEIVARTPQRSSLCPEFWAIAHAHPEDPGVAEGLAWIARYAKEPPERLRAISGLTATFIRSSHLTEALQGLSAVPPTQEVERQLRRIVELSPLPRVRAAATFQLSWVVAGLASDDPDAAQASEVRLLEVVRDVYADEPHWYEGTFGEAAERRLFEIRHLLIGCEAPEIQGQDLAGAELRLSDLRGRVVLIDFWGHW